MIRWGKEQIRGWGRRTALDAAGRSEGYVSKPTVAAKEQQESLGRFLSLSSALAESIGARDNPNLPTPEERDLFIERFSYHLFVRLFPSTIDSQDKLKRKRGRIVGSYLESIFLNHFKATMDASSLDQRHKAALDHAARASVIIVYQDLDRVHLLYPFEEELIDFVTSGKKLQHFPFQTMLERIHQPLIIYRNDVSEG